MPSIVQLSTSPLEDAVGNASGYPLPAHYHDLDAALNAAWNCLETGAANRKSPFHTVTVATVAAGGAPSLRTVVLRGFSRSARALRFHTDVRSRKFSEIERDSRLAVHAYDQGSKIQLRLDCLAQINTNDAAAKESWIKSRPMSRACYAQAETPGQALARTDTPLLPALADDAAFSNFAVVVATVVRLEWLYLAAQGHRRAHFDWRGAETLSSWVAP